MLESTCCDVLEERLDGVESAINSFFILINCIIIFFMKTGFALLEAGSVRAKNTTHILMKNLIDTALSCFIFWAIGYALCFGSDNNSFIGTHRFFLIQTPAKDYPLFFYELVYACASGTIVSGALAERAMIWGYIIYSTIMTGFIYPVVAHWIFNSGGWLYELGFIDKSGSCVIHVTGGVASLVGAIILGPRIGRFGKRGKVNSIPGHSTVLTTLGFFILWFGFLSFNAVSEKGIVGEDHNIEAPSRAIVATLLAGSGGLLSALIITKMSIRKAEVKFFKKEFHIINVFGGFWSIGASMNGSLAGIISICAGNDLYDPWDAFVIGSISGAIYCFYARLTLLIRVDDPVNAFAVHFGGGSWGTIALSLFLPDDRTAKLPNGGILYSWNRDAWRFFGIQLLGVTVVTAWVGVLSVFLFGSLQILHLFRASKRSEKAGLDYVNGQPAYPIDAALLQAFNPKISTSDEDEDEDEDDGDIDEFTADAEDEEEEDDEEE